MKKITLLVACCILALATHAQTYPFNTPGAFWGQFFIDYSTNTVYNQSLMYTGDTTINGLTYGKMESLPTVTFGGDGYYVRDSSGYIYVSNINQAGINEHLVFNFNLAVGDTIEQTQFNQTLIVQSIGTMTMLDGSVRKSMILDGPWLSDPVTWVEGIGDLDFGLWPIYAWPDGGFKVLCYGDTSGKVYEATPVITTCDSLLSCLPTVLSFDPQVSGDTLQIVNNSTFTDSYTWDFGNGTTSTDPHPTTVYADTGTYTVCMIGTGNCSSDTVCQPVHITARATTGVGNNHGIANITISPNPSTGTVMIQHWTAMYDVNWELYDLAGRVCHQGTLRQDGNKVIDTGSMFSGTYILKLINTVNGEEYRHKLLLMR